MSTLLPVILLVFLSFLGYLFYLWKYLKEDYETNLVFGFGLITSLVTITAVIITARFGIFWFWAGIISFLIVSALLIKRNKFRVIEIVEAATPGFLMISLTIMVSRLLFGWNLQVGIIASVTAFLLVLFFILKQNYKKFVWYKSGRLGFASLVCLGLYFLVRSSISILVPNTFSLVSVFDFIPSAIISFFCFFTVYNLSNG